jgi:leader peptidase (prepilin peptidase)/N-methyltransferase
MVIVVGAVLAAVEAVLVWRIGPTAALAGFAYLGAVGTVASVIDLRTRRLPDKIILPSYPITVALLAVAAGVGQDWWPLARAVIAAALVAGFYLALGLAFPHGLGLGDTKLGALLALGLGWLGWPTLTTGVLAAWGTAALALLALLAIGPHRRDRTIALGPWLCLGALVAVALR